MELGIDKEVQKALITCSSIFCITGLMAYALSLGHDGLMLTGATAAIAALGGYKVKSLSK